MESSFKNRIIIFLVIAGILIGANFVFADQIKNFSYSQSFGFQRTVWQMASALTFTNQNQAEANKNLTEENQKLLSALAELETTKEENRFLKNALNIGLEKEYKLIEAEAFGGGRFNGKDFSYEDSVLINKGKNDGVQKGFPVVVSGKVLIGKILEVYDNFSRVSLITDKSSLIDIQIINSAKMEDLVVAEKATTAEGEQEEQGEQNNSNNDTDQKLEQETDTSEKIIAIAKGDGGFKIS
ncbi:rod shape-determining protein MreC, partial [bacterium]|nr:rod shape-determining protein MreC [bacterium]